MPLGSWNTASSWKISSIAARRRAGSLSPNTSWRLRSNKVDTVSDMVFLGLVCGRLRVAAEKLHPPVESDPCAAAVLGENFGERTQTFSACPVALPFAQHREPVERRYAGSHHAPDRHVMRFDGHAARG